MAKIHPQKRNADIMRIFFSGDFFPAGEFLFFIGQKSVLSKVSDCQMSKSFIEKSQNSM
jgi:hypothetical protein